MREWVWIKVVPYSIRQKKHDVIRIGIKINTQTINLHVDVRTYLSLDIQIQITKNYI